MEPKITNTIKVMKKQKNKNSALDLEIIVVNFNTEFWLKKTLTTLQQKYLTHTSYSVNVTVVDNNSSDTSVETVKNEFPWVKLICLDENTGFATANNVGISQTKAKYVMLLNSDMEFTENSNLDTLISFCKKHKDIGCITPKVIFIDGTIDPACHRGDPTPWVAFTYFSGLEKIFSKSQLFGEYHQSYKDFNTIHTIDACSGAAMLVSRAVINKVGLLDERFFMYAEDLDWCKRMRNAGYLITFHPGVSIIHHKYKSGLKSTSQTIAKKTRLHFYNTMLQYYDKHYRSQYPEWMRYIIKYFIVYKKGAL